MNIINQKNWDDMEFEKEIRTWLTFLLSLVDIADVSANECFRQFFSGEYRCCVEHHKFIKKEVSFGSTVGISMKLNIPYRIYTT